MALKQLPFLKKGTGETAALPPSRKKWLKIGIILLALILAAAIAAKMLLPSRSAVDALANLTYQYETVTRRDITSSLQYSGSLEPADSYEVTSLVSGEILDAPFEEGDVLEKDALLYSIDTADAQNSIDRAELSLEQAQMNYQKALDSMEKLTVTAKGAGTVVQLDVEPGDEVQAGQQLGTIRNSSVMSLKVPFNAANAQNIQVGATANVTIDGSFESLTGTVTKVSTVDEVLAGGMVVRYLTIEVQNPGAIAPEATASAMVGDIACNSSGTFSYQYEGTITAETAGTVASISAEEGSWLEKGDTILTLTSTDLENSLKNGEISLEDAQLSLENTQEQLENYQITSPISGTVITKNYKAGDNLSSTGGNTSLCTIYDLSYLTMTLNVDELDISSIEIGQKVTITADAVEGKVYQGEVTAISVQGTTAGGATSYPVTIRIDETEGLLPGMNVDAQIVVSSAEQVLTVPTSAVQRGNRVLVSVDSEAGKAALAAQSENGEQTSEEQTDSTIPEGYIYVEVTLGLSDDDYIQITDGLNEGDQIAYANMTQSGTEFGQFGMEMTTMPSDMGNTVIVPADGGMGGGPGGMGGGRP